jgi:hypothetical protein
VKREATLPPVSPPKAALSVDEVEKKSKAIIEEYLHLNDMKVGTGEGLVIACKGWGRGGMLTGMVYIGWGPGNDGFLLHMYCLRRQYSVSRSWLHPPCSSSSYGLVSSPRWSVVPLLVSIWGDYCTNCSVRGTSLLPSTIKGRIRVSPYPHSSPIPSPLWDS